MNDLRNDAPLAKFESEEWLDKFENKKYFDSDEDFIDKPAVSLEDLVNSFDKKVSNCLKDYKQNVGNIVPFQNPNQRDHLEEYITNWWTLTGNYGPFLPIDWNQTLTKQLYLPSICKTDNYPRQTEPKMTSNEIQNKWSINSTLSHMSKKDTALNDIFSSDKSLTDKNITINNKDSNDHLSEELADDFILPPIQTADEVIKEINRILKDSPSSSISHDSGVTPEMFGSFQTNPSVPNENDFSTTFSANTTRFSSFHEACLNTYDKTVLEQCVDVERLESIHETLSTAVSERSEVLIANLALRDELEYEKELINTFISLVVTIQNKKQRYLRDLKQAMARRKPAVYHFGNDEEYSKENTVKESNPRSGLNLLNFSSARRKLLSPLTSPMVGSIVNKLQNFMNSATGHNSPGQSNPNTTFALSKSFLDNFLSSSPSSSVSIDSSAVKNTENFTNSDYKSKNYDDILTSNNTSQIEITGKTQITNGHINFECSKEQSFNRPTMLQGVGNERNLKNADNTTEQYRNGTEIYTNESSPEMCFKGNKNRSLESFKSPTMPMCNKMEKLVDNGQGQIISNTDLNDKNYTYNNLYNNKSDNFNNFKDNIEKNGCNEQTPISENNDQNSFTPLSTTSVSSLSFKSMSNYNHNTNDNNNFSNCKNIIENVPVSNSFNNKNEINDRASMDTKMQTKSYLPQTLMNNNVKKSKNNLSLLKSKKSFQRDESDSFILSSSTSPEFSDEFEKERYLTTIIPYDFDIGPPNIPILQRLIKILNAMVDGSNQIPTLLTDYILTVICPQEK